MATSLDALRVRRVLGHGSWSVPKPFGDDGWYIDRYDGEARVIVSVADFADAEWIHASMSCRTGVPNYAELKRLHRAAFNGGYAYQVFAPPDEHVNIHPRTLHLWGRLDGKPALPEFAINGSI